MLCLACTGVTSDSTGSYGQGGAGYRQGCTKHAQQLTHDVIGYCLLQ